MSTISAIYEGAIFRPTEPVDLPENCRVRFEPDPAGMPPRFRDPRPYALPGHSEELPHRPA